MPALYSVGLTYLFERAVRGPKTWIMLSPRFFVPLRIARLPKNGEDIYWD